MKKIGLALFFLFSSLNAFPCTVFRLEGPSPLVAKTLDWWTEHGMALVNLRGLEKQALLLDPSTGSALQWESLYGSVTFNQVSREFPFGGMNEKGLVVEVLWLDDSEYPKVDKSTSTINESQWIQFLLDTAASTKEAVNQLRKIQIQMAFAPVHFMICDATSECAAVEFLGEKLVVTTGADLPLPALTNDSYEESSEYLAGFSGFGGSKAISKSQDSLDRFVVAAAGVKNTLSTDANPARATQIMNDVLADNTVWKLLYQDQKIIFSTQKHSALKKIDLSIIDFSCQTGRVEYFDLQRDITGTDSNSYLQPLTVAQNQSYLKKTVYLPAPILKLIADFTASPFPCRAATK